MKGGTRSGATGRLGVFRKFSTGDCGKMEVFSMLFHNFSRRMFKFFCFSREKEGGCENRKKFFKNTKQDIFLASASKKPI